MTEEKKTGWGGKRAGAGRPKGTTKDISMVRKQRQVRAFDEEWEMIKEFAAIVKKDPVRAKDLLKQADTNN